MFYICNLWTSIFQIFIWGSMLIYFIFLPIYSLAIGKGDFYDIGCEIYTRPTFYLVVLINVLTTIIIDYSILLWRRIFHPKPNEIYQEYDELYDKNENNLINITFSDNDDDI